MGEDFMNLVPVHLPEDEAKKLYRHLHQTPGAQDQYWETYRQLQAHFFQTLTIQEVTALLENRE